MCRVGLKVIFSFSMLIIINVPSSNGKALVCPQADMLNIAFQGLPYALARLKISHRAVSATKLMIASSEKNEHTDQDHKNNIKPLNKEIDPTVVKEQVHKIFEPVKEFLSEIRRCSFFIKPLLEKSLPEKIIKKSYLIKFMNSSHDLIEFFEHEITNKEKLSEVCEEFDIFLKDMEDSLSPETQKAYLKFIHEIKQAKKNAHHDEKVALKLFNFEPVDSPVTDHQTTDTMIVPTA